MNNYFLRALEDTTYIGYNYFITTYTFQIEDVLGLLKHKATKNFNIRFTESYDLEGLCKSITYMNRLGLSVNLDKLISLDLPFLRTDTEKEYLRMRLL